MRWRGREKSENVEDRRGAGPARMAVGGGGLGVLLIAVVAMLFGADPRALLGLLGEPQPGARKWANRARALTMKPKSLSRLCSRTRKTSGRNCFAHRFEEAVTSHPG